MKSRRGRKLKRLASVLSIALVAVVAIGAGGAWWMGSQLLAAAPHSVGAPPGDFSVEDVTIASESGADLAGWFVPASVAQPKGVVVLLHPIRGSRLSMVNRARMFHDAGFAVLLFDFQAHGESAGEHITAGYLERLDARAAVRFVRQRCPDQPIIVNGASLGGAAALLASPLDIDALIIESVYPTIDEAVRNRIALRTPVMAGVLAELLLVQLEPRLGVDRHQLRPIEHIGEVGCPVLVMIGSEDPLTTKAEAQRMFDAAHEPKEFCAFDEAGHVDLCECSPVQFEDVVLSFIARHVPATKEVLDRRLRKIKPMINPDMISPRTDVPGVVRAIVEIPKGRRSKFELDYATGLMRLDRYLYSSSQYPGDYGFIPQTLAADGDALDIIIMVNEGTFSGCLIEARVLGVFKMNDRGQEDWKLLAVPNTDPLFSEILDLDDVAKPFLREVSHFFETYKQLDGVTVTPGGWFGRDEALAALDEALAVYANKSATTPAH